MAATPYDPKKYLSFSPCSACLRKPCDTLRFGGVFPGKCRIAYRREFSPYAYGCPFKCDDPWERREILELQSFYQIKEMFSDAQTYLSQAERLAHEIAYMIQSEYDQTGYIEYLIRLCENDVISLVRVPIFYHTNAAMSAWLHTYENPNLQRIRPPAQQEQAAVSDAVADPATGPVNITNPCWEHVDADKRSSRPEKALFGDVVTLKVDITGVPDGAGVRFDLFDTASDRPTNPVASVKTRKATPTTTSEWTVTDTRKSGDSHDVAFEFEGVARDKPSSRVQIEVEVRELYLSV